MDLAIDGAVADSEPLGRTRVGGQALDHLGQMGVDAPGRRHQVGAIGSEVACGGDGMLDGGQIPADVLERVRSRCFRSVKVWRSV